MVTDFDPQVLRAMARWPNVPAMFGWLRLDPRGNWLLIDRGQPGFEESLHGAGSPITNAAILDFIGRNYGHDSLGRWFWQNGPQRVFAELDRAPWVLRVIGAGTGAKLFTHTGIAFGPVTRAALGPSGEVLLESALGCGSVHDLDAAALEFNDAPGLALPTLILGKQQLPVEPCTDPARAFGFVTSPLRMQHTHQ
jgi:hypothetical protein